MVISTLNSGAGWRETGTAMYAPHHLWRCRVCFR
jgi:hypothetical protein